MDAKAPSLCRLCDVKLSSASEWRQHAKSDLQHVVYNLRVKVAEPGRSVTPPLSASEGTGMLKTSTGKQAAGQDTSESPPDSGTDSESDPSTPPQYEPERCLFCSHSSDTMGNNTAHMLKTHGFSVPYSEALAVELEIVLECLHLLVFGYHQCLICSVSSGSTEGIQQHMTAKGHCRIDVNSELREFYKFTEDQSEINRPGDGSLRLPTGKVLSSRAVRNEPRLRRAMEGESSRSRTPYKPADLALAKIEAGENVPPSVQLAQLSRSDQRSLAHLSGHEVRSLVASGVRDVDRSRRQETRAKLKLERAVNKTLMTRSQMGYRVNLLAG